MASIPKHLLQYVDPLLREPRRRVSRAQNARLLWERELPRATPQGVVFDTTDGDGWFGRFEPTEQVKSWLAEHHHDLATLERGLELGDFQLRPGGADTDAPADLVMGLEQVCGARELRARLLAQDGQTAAAAREVTTLLGVGERVLGGCDQILAYLLLLDITRRSLACLRGVARLVPQEAEQLASWLERIAWAEPELAGTRTALVGEFRTQLLPFLVELGGIGDCSEFVSALAQLVTPADTILFDESENRSTARGLGSLLRDHDEPFDLGATLELASRCFAACIRSLSVPWVRRERFPDNEFREVDAAWPDTLRPQWLPGSTRPSCKLSPARARPRIARIANPAGKMLVGSLLGVLELTSRRTTQLRAERLATVLLIAVDLHHRKTGEPPAQLEGLIEHGILPEIPGDPVTGRAPAYCAERGLLWMPSALHINRRYSLDREQPRPGKDLLFLLPPWLERARGASGAFMPSIRESAAEPPSARALLEMQRRIAALPELERVVLALAYGNDELEPLTVAEIAVRLECAEDDVKTLLDSALGHMNRTRS